MKRQLAAAVRAVAIEMLEARRMLSVSVTTYRNDNGATGQNLGETTLTPGNVNVNTFGKRFSTPVDGQVYAEPLYMAGVNITTGSQQGTHDVVYVATEHDSVYAIDSSSGAVLWQRSFINPAAGITTVPYTDVGTDNVTPEIGITSTGVIDPSSNTLYVEAKLKQIANGQAHYVQQLRAIDLGSGADKGITTIADTIWNGSTYTYVSGPSVAGSGVGNVNGVITFNALRQFQRSALTLFNGKILIASASHGDLEPYHGWILAYDASSLQLSGAFCDTPNGYEGGIWSAGDKITVDPQGYMYFQSGNGKFDTTLDANGFPSAGDYGDSIVKLAFDPTSTAANPNISGFGFKVVDYFTPFDQQNLDNFDQDLGSGGPLILPDAAGSAAHPHLLIACGKEGRIYLVDRDNMGKFDPNADHVVQEQSNAMQGCFGTPAYFNGKTYWTDSFGGVAKQFAVANGTFSTTPVSQSPDGFQYPGSSPMISANGNSNGIAWNVDVSTAQLRAYDASSYANELWTSAQAPNGRDALGAINKFIVPTIANGQVYLATTNSLVAFGLLSNQTPVPPPTSNGLDFSAGFTANDSRLTINGATGVVGSRLELTNANTAYQDAGVWAASTQNIAAFTTQFSFQLTSAQADGFTFAIQGAGPAARGAGGGALGYGFSGGTGGIPYSAAIKFDLFSNQGEGNNSTGLVTNGAFPGTAGSISLGNSGIDLHSGHVFNVTLSYDGTNLTEVLKDTATNATFTQSYAVNLPALVGGNNAYVGFTGGTGLYTATQDILSWTFTPTGTPTPPPPPPTGNGFDFSGGFANAGTGLSYNGSAGLVGPKLELTNAGTTYQDASVWSASPQSISAFTTQFSFQLTSAQADGFTFAIQGTSPTAIGARGGSLGYGTYGGVNGIGNSAAIKFDLFDNQGEGNNSTGLFTNGAFPGAAGSVSLANTGIDLHSGHVFNVTLTYDGSTLTETITDTATNATFTRGYSVNLPALVGGSSAYVGFTGGTGLYTATQDVLGWKYTPSGATPPPPPPTGGINLSGGFANAGTALTLNGSTGIVGSKLELTNAGATYQDASAWSASPQSIGSFTTQFSFQLTSAQADGFTFAIQGASASAIGARGGSLGYGTYGGVNGIPNSAAIKFDLFDNQGEGNNSTGLSTNGAFPGTAGSVSLANTGIDLHSGHVFNVTLKYDGATLTETLLDTSTNASFTHAYAVNLPALVGGSNAYVGFTGGTGLYTATQDILGWVFGT